LHTNRENNEVTRLPLAVEPSGEEEKEKRGGGRSKMIGGRERGKRRERSKEGRGEERREERTYQFM